MSDAIQDWENRNADKRARLEASLKARGRNPKERTLRTLKRLMAEGEGRVLRGEGFRERDLAKIRRHQPEKLTRNEREQLRRQWLEKCAVPAAYHCCTRDAWQPTWKGRPALWDPRLDTWRGDPWCLSLRGRPGLGKTHLAVALMQEWVRCDERRGSLGATNRVRFVSVPRAVRELQDWFRRGPHAPSYFGRPLPEFYGWVARSWDLVVFDDLGGQPDRDNWLTVVSGWIYDRHAEGLPTIITLNPGDVQGLEDRAARRISDGLVITLKHPGGRR